MEDPRDNKLWFNNTIRLQLIGLIRKLIIPSILLPVEVKVRKMMKSKKKNKRVVKMLKLLMRMVETKEQLTEIKMVILSNKRKKNPMLKMKFRRNQVRKNKVKMITSEKELSQEAEVEDKEQFPLL